MSRADMDSPKWKAVRALWQMGAPLTLIAAVGEVTPGFIERTAKRRSWAVPDAKRLELAAGGTGPDAVRARMMAAVARRFGDLAGDLAAPDGNDETVARRAAALAKTTDAVERLARSFEGEATDDAANVHDADRSLRRKLQAMLGRAREA